MPAQPPPGSCPPEGHGDIGLRGGGGKGSPWLRSPLLAMPRQHTLGRVTPWGLVPRWVRAAQGTGHRRATGGQPSSCPGPPPQRPEHKAGETPGLRVTFGIMQASHLPPPACLSAFLDRKQKVDRNGHQMTVQEGSREPGRWGVGVGGRKTEPRQAISAHGLPTFKRGNSCGVGLPHTHSSTTGKPSPLCIDLGAEEIRQQEDICLA